MGVFSLEFIRLFNSRICFEKYFYIFAAGHFVYKRVFNFRGTVIDFPRCFRFFCHPGSFLNENYWFLMVKLLFLLKVLVFLVSSIL